MLQGKDSTTIMKKHQNSDKPLRVSTWHQWELKKTSLLPGRNLWWNQALEGVAVCFWGEGWG